MSWLQQLSKTYRAALGSNDAHNPENSLLPVSHTTQLADIELTVDNNYLNEFLNLGLSGSIRNQLPYLHLRSQ